jgi:hypothetical protein
MAHELHELQHFVRCRFLGTFRHLGPATAANSVRIRRGPLPLSSSEGLVTALLLSIFLLPTLYARFVRGDDQFTA